MTPHDGEGSYEQKGNGYQRTCSECDELLPRGSKRKTCTDACRAARSRRKAKADKERRRAAAKLGREQQRPTEAISDTLDVVSGNLPDIANEVAKEAMQPIVREAITDDVLSAVNRMMGLAGTAVDSLGEDMKDADPKIRQKAYDLWFRYTVGNKAVASEEAENSGQMVVNFSMPRPGDDQAPSVEGEAVEMRPCDLCGEDKPPNEFVASSDRCLACHADQQSKVAHLLAGGEGGGD